MVGGRKIKNSWNIEKAKRGFEKYVKNKISPGRPLFINRNPLHTGQKIKEKTENSFSELKRYNWNSLIVKWDKW